MSTTNPLVAATDFSDLAGHAGHRAALLAQRTGATLTLVHVVNQSILARLQHLLGSSGQTEERQRLRDEAFRMLEQQSEELVTRAGVPHSLTLHLSVALGSVHDELIASCEGAALLVVGAHGDNPMRDALLGSTAERLLRDATCPVLLVRRAVRGPYRQVLIPADFSPASAAAFALVECFAPSASITLINPFDGPFEGELQLAEVSGDDIRIRREAAHQEALTELASHAKHRGVRIPSIVERQLPVPLILQAQRSRKADLIVIGDQGPSQVEEFLLGSVARRVLAEARCDVMIATGRSPLLSHNSLLQPGDSLDRPPPRGVREAA